MKIAIAGAGAMGGRFGSMLAKNGEDVVLIDQWEDNVEAINQHGLKIETDTGTEMYPMRAYLPQEIDEKMDLIIFFTKTLQLERMIQAIKQVIQPDTQVLCLLNGLGNIETMEKYFDRECIFMGVTMWTAGMKGPGYIHLSGDGSIKIQNIGASGEKKAQNLCDVLSQAGLKASYSPDIMESIWWKAAINGCLNAPCTILDCDIQALGSTPQINPMLTAILGEFQAVAKSQGISLDVDQIMSDLAKTFDPSQAGKHFPSMHQDLIQHHRLTEIDYMNGYVSRIGKEKGIDTPVNTFITELVHNKEYLLKAQ